MRITELSKTKTIYAKLDSPYAIVTDGGLDAFIVNHYNIKNKSDTGTKFLSDEHELFADGGLSFTYGQWADDPTKARELMRYGMLDNKAEQLLDKAPAEKLESSRTAMKRNRRRKRRNEYDGDLDMDAVMDGNPMYYTKVNKVSAIQRTKRVIINVSANCGVPANQLAQGMAKSIARVERMMREGYAVEVHLATLSTEMFTGNKYQNTITSMCVKEVDKPLDLQRVKTCVYPGMFRYVSFRAFHYGLKYLKENVSSSAGISSGLGYPVNTQQNPSMLKTMLTELSMNEFGSTDQVEYMDVFSNSGKEEFIWKK